jgi:tetratricopeptide (TPR) repeat protein
MFRKALSLWTVLGVVAAPSVLTQPAAIDPEIAKGIRTVEEGDYDAAIVILDQAVRKLAKDPSRARDLSQGYLYLGIAYVGKGHEAAARARFRDALAQVRGLSLSPDKFPPKVIDIFEAARAEAAAQGAGSQPKKGGGGKGLLIGIGVAAAAGVGVAVAAGGGDSSGSGGSSTTPAPTSTASVTEVYQGLLTQRSTAATIPLPTTTVTGSWRAELTWTGTATEVRMFVLDAATRAGVAEVRLVAANASLAEWQGQQGRRYETELFLQPGGAAESSYTLRVTYPR